MKAFPNTLWAPKQKWKHFLIHSQLPKQKWKHSPIHCGTRSKNGSLSWYIPGSLSKKWKHSPIHCGPKAKMEAFPDTFPAPWAKLEQKWKHFLILFPAPCAKLEQKWKHFLILFPAPWAKMKAFPNTLWGSKQKIKAFPDTLQASKQKWKHFLIYSNSLCKCRIVQLNIRDEKWYQD